MQSSAAISESANAKVKSQTLTNGAAKATKPAEASQAAPTQDLAEQLNEDLKRKYVKDRKLGEGTYAIVYLGHYADDASKLVAIKKIKINPEWKDGLAMDAIREVKFLQELSHPNIISLQSIFSSKGQNLNLVLEYLPLGDLEMLIKDTTNVSYGPADIKAWMGMLGRAVWFCHENFVLHRDIKPNNLFIAADGEMKLADFGLARSFADPYNPMTHQVITRWYRPPELFYRARFYSGAVDVWSMGTVFAELILRVPFLAGNSDLHQLEMICEWIGTPTEENWPGVSQLDDYVQPDVTRPVRDRTFFKGTFGAVGDDGIDLLMGMLKLDPRKRISAKQALQHKWWTVAPRPSEKESLPRKAGGEKKMGEDLKKRGGGELEPSKGDKIARKLDFGAAVR
ncbi:MAG: TFIIH complex serine/threonine-protein kinase subunit kin28 [Chrysothrix sp. TS-e1954]|nr:MAG: TFIIH complex serine/threonine-protein kinase subunit kin28 [Chrysothrix sp. TS-e1954]